MIGSLRGTLLDRSGGGLLTVEVGGVGYRVTVPSGSATLGARIGSTVFLWVHTYVKEDALSLYGFETSDERECFEALIGAHGVGPSLALAILGVHSPSALHSAIAAQDVDALMLVPGVGRKTAQRLVIDLASRLGAEAPLSLPGGGLACSGARAEVRDALAGLGYGPEEVRTVVATLPEEGEAGELLKIALRELSRAR